MVRVEEDRDLGVERRGVALARLDLPEAGGAAARLPVGLVEAAVEPDRSGGADRAQAQRLLGRREGFLPRQRARGEQQPRDQQRRGTMRAAYQRDTDLGWRGGRVVALW
jgi:hypothetical protein